jgi:PAS domain S-box-containing protein
MRPHDRPPLLRYGCAVVSVALMTWLRLSLPVGPRHRFTTLFLAVIATAWYGGLGPSVLAIVLSCLVADYFFLPPYHSFVVEEPDDLLGIAMFVVVCSAIVAFSEAGRAARRRLELLIAERQRTEQAEREQRERLQTTLSSVGDGVIVTDRAGRVVSLNPVAQGLTGWPTAEAEGRPLKGVFRTVDRLTHRTDEMPVVELVEGGISRQMDHTELVARDGSTLAIEHCAAPIKDEAGAVKGVVIVFRDITERTKSEAALRESEERFARFMQQLPGLAWIKDVEGRYVYANDAAVSAFRTPRAGLYGRTDDEVFPPETAAQFKENDRRVLATGTGIQVIETLEHDDGVNHHSLVSKFPITGRDGRTTLVGGMAIDITDRKRAEEALRLSEEQYRAVYSQAATGIAEADLSGRFVRANDRFCEIVGYPRDELIGVRFSDLTHPDDRAESVGPFERLRDGGPNYTIEKRYVRRDGMIVWARVAVSLIRDEQKRPARVVAVIEEITDRKRLEDELQRRVEELAQADRRKDEFLATLAHELRNPLAPIRNALHLMRRPNGDGLGIEAERAMAERQVVHLARLIDDLMDIARISRGKIELRRERLELAPVVGRAVESVRASLDERRHELTVAMPPEPIHLEADPTRIEQVLWNLLNNAIKYTEPGGAIRLGVERAGGEVVVRVRDTGVGIEPAMLPRIFEMFVQVGDDSGRAQGGLGIGLSLVSTLVEMHGGRVTVRSEGRGKGTEFAVHLPILPDAVRDGAEMERCDAPRSDAQPPRRRVLVVDDNVDAATSLAKLLTRFHGQDVRVAHDGPAALREAGDFRPDVVLLDIGMPGMDGCEVARRLRAQPETGRALLVALTGWGQESDRQRSREAGFDHHLVKPVDPDALRDLLAEPKAAPAG